MKLCGICWDEFKSFFNYNVDSNIKRECYRKIEKIKKMVYAEIKAYIESLNYVSAKYQYKIQSAMEISRNRIFIQRLSKTIYYNSDIIIENKT